MAGGTPPTRWHLFGCAPARAGEEDADQEFQAAGASVWWSEAWASVEVVTRPYTSSQFGANVLLRVAGIGDLDGVVRLLEAPVNPDHKHGGSTGLHWAARHGNKEVVLCLLEAGADKDLVNDGRTALRLLIMFGHQAADCLQKE